MRPRPAAIAASSVLGAARDPVSYLPCLRWARRRRLGLVRRQFLSEHYGDVDCCGHRSIQAEAQTFSCCWRLTIVGGAVRRGRLGAAGAWGKCAPAALVRRGRPAPQLHR